MMFTQNQQFCGSFAVHLRFICVSLRIRRQIMLFYEADPDSIYTLIQELQNAEKIDL